MQQGDEYGGPCDGCCVSSVTGLVADAVTRELAELEKTRAGISDTPEAALALSLAQRIDSERSSPTSVSMNAGRLLDTLVALRTLAAATAGTQSPLDEIRERRDRKLASGR